MARIEEIKERLSKIDTNMKLYRCSQFIHEDEACGIYENQTLDCSYDECHHPLSLDLAEYIVNTPADIEYLLSRIQIAEKALEWYAKIPHYDRRLSGGTSAIEADAGGRAREALEQIQKE